MVLKYKSPSVSALPSKSVVGSDAKEPRYWSVNVSNAASAAACALDAAVALLLAFVSLVEALEADVAAFV